MAVAVAVVLVEMGWVGLTQEIHVCRCDMLCSGYPLYIANSWSRRDQEFWVHEHIFCRVAGSLSANHPTTHTWATYS
jgi:hypothetical protein